MIKTKKQESIKKWQLANQSRYLEWKSIQSCKVCGESETCTLDLHHLDPSTKEYQIAVRAANVTWKTLEKEIQKCVVLCSNCHRKVHAGVLSIDTKYSVL